MSGYARRVPAASAPVLSRLARLDIELTERCDNDCIHCCINLPVGDAAARAREMTTTQLKVVLRQAADLGALQVRFTGGEPLLRPDFKELYLFARRLGLAVLLFTNARRVTPGLADLLARTPPREPIEVTVYGMHRESYEAVTRVPGSYAQFRSGVDLLLDRGVPFMVKGVLLPPTRGEAKEFEAWAATLPGMTEPPSYVVLLDLRNRRDSDEKNRLIASLRLPPDEAVAVLARDEATYRADMEAFAARFMGPSGAELFRCGAGHAISVDAYGRAQPCMGVRAPDLTVDVLAASLSDALERFAGLRELRATNPEYLRRCARCFLHGLCEQCPAKSWSEHGTLDTPVEYLWEATHAQARFLGWLVGNEKGWNRRYRSNSAGGDTQAAATENQPTHDRREEDLEDAGTQRPRP